MCPVALAFIFTILSVSPMITFELAEFSEVPGRAGALSGDRVAGRTMLALAFALAI